MVYLLDTHTALWSFLEPEKLPPRVMNILSDSTQKLVVSVASVWEIAIKLNIGKMSFEGGVQEFIRNLKDSGIAIHAISSESLTCYENLPLIHRDPFDRILVTAAISENLTILSADTNIHKYNVKHIWE